MSLSKKISKKLWGDRNARLLGSTQPTARVRSLESVTDSMNEAVYKLGLALQGLTNDGDTLILSFSPDDDVPSVAYATGVFTSFAKGKVSPSFVSLHRSAGVKTGAVLIFDTMETQSRADLGLNEGASGSVAMTSVELGLEGTLSVAIFKPTTHGRFAPRDVSALQAICQLAAGFAAAHDPVPPEKLESQIRIDSLENEVREAKDFYDLLLESISQCYWMLDLDSSRVLTVSENFEDVWGASRTILTEGGLTGFMSTVHMEDRDHVLANFHTRLGHAFDQEFRIISSDGEKRWIWLRVSPVEGEMGEVARLVFIADDVTDKKNEEERFRAKEAELINRARSLAASDLGAGVEKSHSHGGHAAFDSSPLSGVANQVRDVLKERFEASGVGLEIQTPPDSMIAEMNKSLVAQLILNLAHNAFDAVQSEKEKWVRLEFSEDKDSVYVAVTDSGPGIAIKNRSRIFDPFFTTKPPGQGTGLGLSLATSIAAQHHGCLRLDTLSSRTRFVFQLPKVAPTSGTR